jgi:CHAT domain-containing protein
MMGRAPSGSRGGLDNLKYVPDEARVITHAWGSNMNQLLEDQATVERVRRAMPEAGAVHFATHAFPNPSAPLMSPVVLARSSPEDPGVLYARDVYHMRLNAGVAVLSACDTMRGKGTGEGILGLAWSFMVAGCPSTVATRWRLTDASTPMWVEEFYRHYRQGKSKAFSYQQACLKMIQTRGKAQDFSSPAHWANWVLVGGDY